MPRRGYKQTAKHIKRRSISLSKAMIGNQNSVGRRTHKTKMRIKNSRLGMKLTDKTKEKMRDSHLGEKSSWYIDGRSSLNPRCRINDREHRKWAKQIRKRDDHICQLCGKEGHCAHHIDYDKDNFDLDNGVCLCISCHNKTSFNREVWSEFFKILITIFKKRETKEGVEMKMKFQCSDCGFKGVTQGKRPEDFQCTQCGSFNIEVVEDEKRIDKRQERKLVRDIKASSSRPTGGRKRTLSDYRPKVEKMRDDEE